MGNEGDEKVETHNENGPSPNTHARAPRDTRRILVMRGLRSLAYGLLAVLLGVALAGEGFTPVAIGALITVSLVGDMVGTYVIGLSADTWGRRRTLALLALLMAATGIIFGLVTRYPVLLVTAFFGTLGTSASETAPFLPIDQTMIAQVTKPEQRTSVFARYNLVASFSAAAGALAVSLPGLLTRTGLPLASGVRLMFGVYAVLAFIVAGMSLQLSSDVEAPPHRPIQAQSRRSRLVPPLHRSRGIVLRLTAPFSVDALAGGLVVQSLIALYFLERFGVPLTTLSILFFGANLLSALSFLATVPLARRFGLLNTMVFTHLPSNVLLILVAPEEPTAAARVTSLARSVGSSTSPFFSGLLLQRPRLILGLPFILAGMLKSAYDCTLWMVFRHVHLVEDQRSSTQEPVRPGEVTHAPHEGARTQTDDGRSRHR